MQIYWNKRKNLYKKRVQLPQDFLGIPKWPPFHCFETPIWPPCRHVNTLSAKGSIFSKISRLEKKKNYVQSLTSVSRDGAVVRALAFHQCGPGSIPGLDVICGLSLLLVLFSAPRGFSPGTPVFPSPQKPTFLNSNSIRNARAFNT